MTVVRVKAVGERIVKCVYEAYKKQNECNK